MDHLFRMTNDGQPIHTTLLEVKPTWAQVIEKTGADGADLEDEYDASGRSDEPVFVCWCGFQTSEGERMDAHEHETGHKAHAQPLKSGLLLYYPEKDLTIIQKIEQAVKDYTAKWHTKPTHVFVNKAQLAEWAKANPGVVTRIGVQIRPSATVFKNHVWVGVEG